MYSRAAQFEQAAAHFIRAGANFVDNRRKRNSISAELVGVEVDLILPHEAADGGDFGHARNGLELIAQIPVLKAAKVRETWLMARDRRGRIHTPIPRRLHRGRWSDARLRGRFALICCRYSTHAGARPVEVGSVLEDDEDIRIAEHGLRAHGLYMRRREQGRDDGIGDLVFDDGGRLALPFGVDDDLQHPRCRAARRAETWLQAPDAGEHEHAAVRR